MKKILIFFAIISLAGFLYFFWPFSGRNFNLGKPFFVTISDNGLIFKAKTEQLSVEQLLSNIKMPLEGKDSVFPPLETKASPGQTVTIRRSIPIEIKVDGETIKIDTLGTTVEDAVKEAGVVLSHADKIKPELNSTLVPNASVDITRINFEEIAIEEDIPFQTVEKEDSTVLWRKKEIKQKGEKGVREKTYKITYTNGKETNRSLLGSTISKQPVSQIEVVGTKIIVGKTDSGMATWYENGEDLTCASLDFAFGKYLRVTNRASGKSVIVRVNDSGPYGKGRIIDLNKPAFKKIAGLGEGVINVKVEEILN